MRDIRFPLPEQFHKFVEVHLYDDPKRLRLEFHGRNTGFDTDFAITQIECRRKFAKKLPSFVSNPDFIFPSELAGEQSTNEAVSRFHVSLIDDRSSKIIDMTAGLGIDAITFARKGFRVDAIEIELAKQQCLFHNAEILGLKNLRASCADSTILFSSCKFDPETVIFIDPHRRDSRGGRVYGLKECVPDVSQMLPQWNGQPLTVFLKLSPMLDIDRTITEIPWTTAIYVVCYKGECKEILVKANMMKSIAGSATGNRLTGHTEKEYTTHDDEIILTAIDLDDNGVISEFSITHGFAKVPPMVLEDTSEIESGHYLYVPSAGMMKLGAWGAICSRFPGLSKLSGSTPLFSSMWYYRSFPGRVLRIEKQISSSELKKLKGERLNVISRNYPLTADQLRKKAAVKEGSSLYLVGAKTGRGGRPTLFLCSSDPESDPSLIGNEFHIN